LLAVAGVVAALLGVWLAQSPRAPVVGLDAAGYHLGSTLLPPLGGGVYATAEAAVVIRGTAATERAAASTRLDGRPMTGVCTATDAGGERCEFRLGGRQLASTDRLQNGAWERRYDDGARLHIDLVGGRAAPLPFALGR
ncbi:MAG: hypothetical protein M3024_08315, partial [Candidatus Dormibacteraeota bacterium]|nr:hypothetical protein [Candidatus Dormibacteraeota bacterium]